MLLRGQSSKSSSPSALGPRLRVDVKVNMCASEGEGVARRAKATGSRLWPLISRSQQGTMCCVHCVRVDNQSSSESVIVAVDGGNQVYTKTAA